MIVLRDLALEAGDRVLVAGGQCGLSRHHKNRGRGARRLERLRQVHRLLARRAGRQERTVVGVDGARQRGQQGDAQRGGDQPAADDGVAEPDRESRDPGHEVFHRPPATRLLSSPSEELHYVTYPIRNVVGGRGAGQAGSLEFPSPATGSRLSETELMHQRWSVGTGYPSPSKTCPRWESQRAHLTSVRVAPSERSSISTTASSLDGW